jgi:hypothetical protein
LLRAYNLVGDESIKFISSLFQHFLDMLSRHKAFIILILKK